MKQTRNENLLAGLTSEAQDGQTSKPSMKHGEESPAMLLALLNSPLQSMVANKQAKIMGKAIFRGGRVGTLIIFYEAEPTANNTLQVAVKTVQK